MNREPDIALSSGKSLRGFTLIELVIVIILLSILAAVVVPHMGRMITQARITATKSEMKILSEALVGEESFFSHVGRLPTTAEGLSALITAPAGVSPWDRWTERGWRGPYVEADGDEYRRDAWGNLYHYWQLTPTSGRIRSDGPDGIGGGGGTTDNIELNFGH